MKTLVGSDDEPLRPAVLQGLIAEMRPTVSIGGHEFRWAKPSACFDTNCAEVAISPHGVHLRSTEAPAAVVTFSYSEWTTLVHAIEDGEFRVPE